MIETATEVCSVALFDQGQLVSTQCDMVGRGHAERLIPMIAALPDGGRANHILVGCGPGSFTGIRVGVSAARALGLAWDADVHGFSSLALLAVRAFAQHTDCENVDVAIYGGHGELFVQSFGRNPFSGNEMISTRPEQAADLLQADCVTGNAAAQIIAARGFGLALTVDSAAEHAMLLPESFRTLPPSPLYVRGADATPMVMPAI